MVFIEPNIAAQIGTGGLDQLVAGINHAINPDYGFQQAMKLQLATNPKLAQQLSDLEVQAPGTLKRLGFGPLTNILTGIPESAAGQVAREAKPNIVETEKAKIAAEGGQAKLEGSKFAGALNAIEGDTPDAVALRHEFINRFLTGSISPQDELAQIKAQTREQTARATELEAELPQIQAKGKIAQDTLDEIIKNRDELKGYDVVNIIQDMINGKPAPAHLAAFLSPYYPGGQQLFQHAQTIIDAREARANRLFMREMSSGKNDPEYRANLAAARQAWVQTKAGTPQAWFTLITEPEKVNELRQKDFTTLPQEDKDVLYAANAQEQQQAIITQRQTFADLNQFRTQESAAQINAKRATTEAGKQTAIAPLNKYLSASGSPYQAKYGSPPDVGSSEPGRKFFGMAAANEDLYYIDSKTGKRVEDSAISNFISNPSTPSTPEPPPATTKTPTKPVTLSPDASRTLGVIKLKTGADRQATIDWVKEHNPTIYNQIKSQIEP